MTGVDLLNSLPVVAILAAGVWLLRLEGRVNTHEAVCAERYRTLEQRHTESLNALADVNAKLDRLMARE